MTQATSKSVPQQKPTIDNALETHSLSGLLKSQQSLDPTGQGSDYNSVSDTALPTVSLNTLTPGTLLYDPRNTDAVLEVIEQYENDFGDAKVRFHVHTEDYRDERIYSYFADQVTRDLAPIQVSGTETESEPTTDTTPSEQATPWEPEGTLNDPSDEHTQSTLVETSPADSEDAVSSSSTDTTNEKHTQTTLFTDA